MWATLRRLLNRRNHPDQEVTNPDPGTAVGRVPCRPARIPYPNERPAQPGGRTNQGPVVGVHRTVNRPSSGRNVPLRPWHVRNRRFSSRLRGLDPTEVYEFLNRTADDLATLYAELAVAREETQRIKDALRRWQSAQAPGAYELARR